MQCPHCFLNSEVPRAFWGQAVICPNCGEQFIASADAFDPYYTWLGIPPAQQPPNLYRLLGLQLYEPNPDVIQNAADRQMTHVRSFQLGAHAADSQRLLNEISSARVVLLDPLKKAAYDEQLHRTLGPTVATPDYESPYANAPPIPPVSTTAAAPASFHPIASEPPAPPPPPAIENVAGSHPLADSRASRRSSARHRTSSATGMLTPFMIVAGAIVGLALGALIVFYITGHDYLGLSANLRKQFDDDQPGAAKEQTPLQNKPGPGLPPRLQPPDVPQGRRMPQPGPAPQPQPPVLPQPLPQQPTIVPPPVAAFPRTVSLPDAALGQPTVVARLPIDAADPIQLSLRNQFAALPANATIAGQTHADTGDFTISYAAMGLPPIALATFRQERTDLVLRWIKPPAESAVQRQVRNCLLVVSAAGETHKIQLREPLSPSPLALDLESGDQDCELEVEDLPRLARLTLNIEKLENFSKAAILRGAERSFDFSKAAFIDFPGMAGAFIRIRLLQQPRSKSLLIKLEPIFREPAGREFELTLAGLVKVEAAAKKTIAESKIPSQVAGAKARINAIPEIRAFIGSLHKKASIRYSVSAVDDDDELVLIGNKQP